MSLDLDIYLKRKITIKDLLFNSREELIKLTCYKDMPYIQAHLLKDGKRIEIRDNYILEPDDVVCLNFQNLEDEVYVTLIEIEPQLPYITEEEAGISASVSMNGNHVLKFFLTAGVALCLSNYCDSDICDERRCWSRERINTYDTFYNELKLNIDSENIQSGLNIQKVCELFYANMKKRD